jgi:hypothetical protein
MAANFARLPLAFEPNVGQTDDRAKFLARGGGYTLFLTADGAVIAQNRAEDGAEAPRRGSHSPRRSVLRMRLVGSRRDHPVVGADELPGKSNYFIGNDPAKWRTNVPTYAQVSYESVYPGIDLVYYGNQGRLEYDFVVGPGADPDAIRLAIEADPGAAWPRSLRLDASGNLLVNTGAAEVRFLKPVVYQTVAADETLRSATCAHGQPAAARIAVQGRYRLSHGQVTFKIGRYDKTRPLVIDPVLGYSTYLGGSGFDKGFAVAVSSMGAIATGATGSTDFPIVNAIQPAYGGGFSDMFISQFNATGSALIFSTYLGGNGDDQSWDVVLDNSGNIYVSGYSASTNFPVTANAYQTGFVGSGHDGVLSKLNSTGSALLYSTYIGSIAIGPNGDHMGPHVAVDSLSNAYVACTTEDPNYPVTSNAVQAVLAGASDGCLTILNTLASGSSSLTYSTFLGGVNIDEIHAIALDSANNVYLTGTTHSLDFPVTAGAYQTSCKLNPEGGCQEAFFSRIRPLTAGPSGLGYSSYFGGTGGDSGVGITVDSSGNTYVTGNTKSTDLPVTPGVFQASCGANCGAGHTYVAKFHPAGQGAADLVYSTYLGGRGSDIVKWIAVDSADRAYVEGRTESTDYPTANPIQAKHAADHGDYDADVSELNPTASALVFSTYLGGSSFDTFVGLALDSNNNIYLAGRTESSDYPVTPGAFQIGYAGGGLDAIVAQISPTNAPGLAVGPGALNFGNQAVGTTSSAQVVIVTAAGTSTLAITGIVASGDFAETNTCLGSMAGGATCTVSVTFTPTTAGTRTGAITLTDNAVGSPQNVNLGGIGIQ